MTDSLRICCLRICLSLARVNSLKSSVHIVYAAVSGDGSRVTTDAYPDVPQELHFGVREGAQSRRRLRRGHRQGMMIPLLQFLRLLPRHRHLVQQRQDVGPLGLRGEKERRI